MKSNVINAADIFSGCGGLTLGLKRSGIAVRVAVDNDPTVRETYVKNHPDTHLILDDVRQVNGSDLLARVPGGKLHVLAGCAPCQGFSSLTRKHRKRDPRNLLVLEMARLVGETRPDIVVMENVPGLAQHGRALFKAFMSELHDLGYYTNWQVVQMADFGVPQNRRRLVLTAGKGFFIPLPTATHARDPDETADKDRWRTLRDAIGNYRAPLRLSVAHARRGGPRAVNWHVVRDLAPITKKRLKAAVPGKSWQMVDEKVRPKCHQGDYIGFTNVYQRMTWDQLPVTVTSGCTVPAKGRFGHPDRRRSTISVREAATLQTFPKGYRFVCDHIDSVCTMIGNAVPPVFAEQLGKRLVEALRDHYAALAE